MDRRVGGEGRDPAPLRPDARPARALRGAPPRRARGRDHRPERPASGGGMRRSIAFVVTALLGSVGVAQGQSDPWRTEVEHALAEARTRLGPGEVVGAGPRLGLLIEGEMTTFTLPLTAGMTYVALAACDRDCDQLSLRVVDSRRYELDVDRSVTRRPVLHFSPVMGGEHRIEVVMAGCRVSPCRYGVLLLAIPRGRTSEVGRSAL